MTVLERTHTTISLQADCLNEGCAEFADGLHRQLSSGRYTWPCSVLPVPLTVEVWRDSHRTARKRASRAERLGYRCEIIDRELFADDIFLINTSLEERQGRPMSNGYQTRQSFAPLPDYPCLRHRITSYGVLRHGRLFAYCWLYRCGDLALVSSILGHGDALRDDVMYLLMQGVVAAETPVGGFLVYNRHDSGTDGLRFFKERLGFRPAHVVWCK